MTDFEKMCEILKIEPNAEFLEKLITKEITLVLDWDENGNLINWGTL